MVETTAARKVAWMAARKVADLERWPAVMMVVLMAALTDALLVGKKAKTWDGNSVGLMAYHKAVETDAQWAATKVARTEPRLAAATAAQTAGLLGAPMATKLCRSTVGM